MTRTYAVYGRQPTPEEVALEQLAATLLEEWVTTHQAKPSLAQWKCAHALTGKHHRAAHYTETEIATCWPPGWDHAELWNLPDRSRVLTYHPYWPPDARALQLFDMYWGTTTVTQSQAESWYWPGNTWLIEVWPNGDAADAAHRRAAQTRGRGGRISTGSRKEHAGRLQLSLPRFFSTPTSPPNRTRNSPRRPQMALSDDVGSGDQLRALEALRDVLAASLEEAAPGSRAALAKQLRETLGRIDALRGSTGESSLDRLAEARRQRRLRHHKGA